MRKLTTICSFIGADDSPDKISKNVFIKAKLSHILRFIYNTWDIDAFYLDPRSKFSLFCGDIVTRMKFKYPEIKIFYSVGKNDKITDNFLIYKEIINIAEVLLFDFGDNNAEIKKALSYAKEKGKIIYLL